MSETFDDPFTAPPAAPEPAPAAAPQAAAKAPAATYPAQPANSPNRGVSVTLKGNGPYSPWIVLHGNDPADALAMMDTTLAELMKRATNAAAVYARLQPGASTAPAASGNTDGGGQPQRAATAPGGAKHCDHGEMVFRSGVSAAGKPWSGHFCPAPKGDPNQCKPVFVR